MSELPGDAWVANATALCFRCLAIFNSNKSISIVLCGEIKVYKVKLGNVVQIRHDIFTASLSVDEINCGWMKLMCLP